jgi:hypothetical protein
VKNGAKNNNILKANSKELLSHKISVVEDLIFDIIYY